jgi:transcriptional regulator with XRE-family HTH domain
MASGVDGELLRRRRLELRISERRLAREIGATVPVIRGMEGGGGAELPLRLLAAVADALALDLASLLRIDSEAAPASHEGDVAAIGAILFEQRRLVQIDGLAAQLGWERTRVEAAAAGLAGALPTVGLSLHRLHASVAIRRATEAVSDDQLASSYDAAPSGRRLARAEAAILADVVEGRLVDRTSLSKAKAGALARLVNQGVVDRRRSGSPGYESPRLTAEARFSLGLE